MTSEENSERTGVTACRRAASSQCLYRGVPGVRSHNVTLGCGGHPKSDLTLIPPPQPIRTRLMSRAKIRGATPLPAQRACGLTDTKSSSATGRKSWVISVRTSAVLPVAVTNSTSSLSGSYTSTTAPRSPLRSPRSGKSRSRIDRSSAALRIGRHESRELLARPHDPSTHDVCRSPRWPFQPSADPVLLPAQEVTWVSHPSPHRRRGQGTDFPLHLTYGAQCHTLGQNAARHGHSAGEGHR